ncbi:MULTISPECIES: hypothetical protein [unclassified Moorena]|uniref:hypothetical protein n=1 Tax=unclassified Moorena TaxID=2683338 RepID=UPI0013FE5691|nr:MULTISPECIES: hypothetical protein [unclassified Moorena]NEO11709.1 hypothetical protein [Moorena sp. SIO3E8]NEP98276.1 hypothetical protein [Moorena sp. SIO3F7]
MNNEFFGGLKRIFSDIFIFGMVFLMVGFFALTPAAFANWNEECNNEGCSNGELQDLYESYASECLTEGCSNEEMYETAGGSGSVCPMFSDFKDKGFYVSPDSLGQFRC